MSQITAEMIERGRGANSRNSSERRRLAYKVREAREKLTTGGAGHGAFEGELLRIYAENRISSAPWALSSVVLMAFAWRIRVSSGLTARCASSCCWAAA